LTLARENESNDIPEAGPGAAVDEAIEQTLDVAPGERAPGTGHAAPAAEVHEAHEPSEHSYWPVVLAASILLTGIGFLTSPVIIGFGSVAVMVALAGWFREPWVS